jgi:phosphatidylglycerophosphate synthase
MTVSTEDATTGHRPLGGGKSRPARELVVDAFFGPVAGRLAVALLPLRVPPPALVLANGAAGFAAAVALERGELVIAAVLLQLKTLLDNADGRLARASGRVTRVGRYLDTEVDFVVNAALFAAIGSATGEPWLALAAFCALTAVLSTGFNLSELYRVAHGDRVRTPPSSGGALERALESVYRAVFGLQDRLVRAYSAKRLERILGGEPDPEGRSLVTRAYHDRATMAVLANLGLSTQLVLLGVCLVLEAPELYLWLVVGSVALLPLLQLRRERLARRALSALRAA